MSDTLEIFGTEYTNVAGFKATDDNDNILAFVRPQGTKSISENGTGIDIAGYATANVSVPTGTARTSADVTANNLTVTVPAGLYAEAASKTLTDANLVAENIKKDISIFGVTGSFEGGGLKYKTGTFTLASDTLGSKTAGTGNRVSHGLGSVPKVVIIWTEDYDRNNPPSSAVNGGYTYLVDLYDMNQYMTSSATGSYPLFNWHTITADPKIRAEVASSTSYEPGVKPDSSYFYLYKRSNSQYWKSGKTYHYFVSEAWW